MKKLLSLLSISSFALCAQAAITTWSASLTATTGYENGYAYLIEVTDATTWTSSSIIAYIKKDGLTGSSESVKASAQLDNTAAYMNEALNVAANSTSQYYTLFLTSDKKQFVLSEVGFIGDDNIFWAGAVPGGATEPDYAAYFSELEAAPWTENGGTVGGGDTPGVPEPTAFALLALGVAGMALRRKVK